MVNLADGQHPYITITQGILNDWPGFNVDVDFTGFTEPVKKLYGIGAELDVRWVVPTPVPSGARKVKVVIDHVDVVNPGDTKIGSHFADGEWAISALIGDAFKHMLLSQNNTNLDVGHDMGAPYSKGVNVGTYKPVVGDPGADKNCLGRPSATGPVSDGNCMNEFEVPLLPGQPLEYGVSITDACIGWDASVSVLRELAVSVGEGRRVMELSQRAPDRLMDAERVRILHERGEQQLERVARLAARSQVA